MRHILIHCTPEEGQEKPELLAAAHALFPVESLRLEPSDLSADARQLSDVIATLHLRQAYDAILMADGPLARDCAPRLAVLIEAAVVTGVTAIRREQGAAIIERPTHDGQATGQFEVDVTRPIILTIKPGHFAPLDPAVYEVEILRPTIPEPAPSGIRLMSRQAIEHLDIRDADILISGGRGVAQNFAALQPLADALGGAVAASRAMVDAGFADRRQQVGQTGKWVSPRLYMALGINGAIQHVQGLKDAEHIISVNTNVDAPICSLSDLVVKGDALTFVEKLLNKIKEEQSNGTL